MAALLTRVNFVGLAKETTPGTYVAPTVYTPVDSPAPADMIASIKDTSIQANDTSLNGQFPAAGHSQFSWSSQAYPSLLGHYLLGILGGVDTTSAAVTTTLAGAITAGTSTASLTATVPVYSTLVVDTGTNKEARQVIAITGAGPYTATVDAPWNAAHSSGVAATTGTLHAIKQPVFPQGQPPTYSLTHYEDTDTRGYPGSKMDQLQLKFDAKGAITALPSYYGFLSASQSQPSPSYTTGEPLLGWQWKINNGTTLSTRGLTCDLTLKRTVEAIASSDGTQSPREIFAGAFDAQAKITAIFDATTDRDAFLAYLTTTNLSLNVSSARTSAGLTILFSKPIIDDFALRLTNADTYMQADFTVSGIYNTTDGVAVSAYLTNGQTTAY